MLHQRTLQRLLGGVKVASRGGQLAPAAPRSCQGPGPASLAALVLKPFEHGLSRFEVAQPDERLDLIRQASYGSRLLVPARLRPGRDGREPGMRLPGVIQRKLNESESGAQAGLDDPGPSRPGQREAFSGQRSSAAGLPAAA